MARRPTVSLFDLNLLHEIGALESPVPAIDLQFSPEGSLLATSAWGIVQVFHTDTRALLTSIPTAPGPAGIAFSPDGGGLAVNGGSYVAIYAVSDLVRGDPSTSPERVVLLPFGTGKASTSPRTHHLGLSYSRSSRRLAAVTEDSVVVLDLPAGTIAQTFPHPDAFLSGLAFLGEDRLVTFSRSRVHEWLVPGGNDSARAFISPLSWEIGTQQLFVIPLV